MKQVKILKNSAINLLPVFSVLLLCIMPSLVIAQDPGGNPDTPIDGGLSLLIAAGAAYGVKKYRSHKAAEKEESAQK